MQVSADYVAAIETQVEILRGELAARNQELSEMRRLLAGALERMPALEAPAEPRSGANAPPDDTEHSRRSWWRRVFLGE
jgi:hypothetical protein